MTLQRWLFIIILVLLLPAPGKAETEITRSFSDIALGMSIEELQEHHPTREVTDLPRMEGERLFAVAVDLPGIKQILCAFYVGMLFRIEVFYSPQFTQEVPWESFVAHLSKGYGQGMGFESTTGRVAIWNDGKTSFVLEQKVLPKSPLFYVASIVDDELYSARKESCSSPKYRI
jgi:hypothetical protein